MWNIAVWLKDVLVNRFFCVNIFFTKWLPKCMTCKLKFKSSRFLLKSIMRTLVGARVLMYFIWFYQQCINSFYILVYKKKQFDNNLFSNTTTLQLSLRKSNVCIYAPYFRELSTLGMTYRRVLLIWVVFIGSKEQ